MSTETKINSLRAAIKVYMGKDVRWTANVIVLEDVQGNKRYCTTLSRNTTEGEEGVSNPTGIMVGEYVTIGSAFTPVKVFVVGDTGIYRCGTVAGITAIVAAEALDATVHPNFEDVCQGEYDIPQEDQVEYPIGSRITPEVTIEPSDTTA